MPMIGFDRWSLQSRSGSKVLHDSLIIAHLHTIVVITSHNNSSKPAEGKGSAVEVRRKAFKLSTRSNHFFLKKYYRISLPTSAHVYTRQHPYIRTQATASGLGAMSLDKKEQEQKEKVARMRELTNADEATARFWLESWAWDLERVRATSLCLACGHRDG